jgi:23S rRNA pseudouridine1911/1915/1917 synthase
MSDAHTLTVDEAHHGVRLDKYLPLVLPHLTRSRVQNLIEAGGVILASGVPLTSASRKVKAGETLTLTVPDIVALDLTPEAIALDIIYEDDTLIVLNKPVGMTVHPAPGATSGTLVHALLSHCGDSLSGIGGVARPGIVHRIDKDTSGLLVVAKHDAAHQHLAAQLKSRDLKRHYIAFGWGALSPPAQTIQAPIARHPKDRKKMGVVEGGRDAITHVDTVARYHAGMVIVASQLHCQLDTGRTHQIRVHLAHKGCALIGDATYGPSTTTRLNRLKAQGIVIAEETQHLLHAVHHQALHAANLQFFHPISGKEMQFSAPLPATLSLLESALSSLTF